MNLYKKVVPFFSEIIYRSLTLVFNFILIPRATVSNYSKGEKNVVELNLRVHLMRDVTIEHEIGRRLRIRNKVSNLNCLIKNRSKGYLLNKEQMERTHTAAKEIIE